MTSKIGSLTLTEIAILRKRNSWRTIADFAGVNYTYFIGRKNELGLRDGKWIIDQNIERRCLKLEEYIRVVNRFGFETIEDYIRARKKAGKFRYEMIAELGEKSAWVLDKYTPKDVSNLWTERRKQVSRDTIDKYREKPKEYHIWRLMNDSMMEKQTS